MKGMPRRTLKKNHFSVLRGRIFCSNHLEQQDVDLGDAVISSQADLSGQLEFSPDGRYVLATGSEGEDYYAYDFVDDKSIKLPGDQTAYLFSAAAITSQTARQN